MYLAIRNTFSEKTSSVSLALFVFYPLKKGGVDGAYMFGPVLTAARLSKDLTYSASEVLPRGQIVAVSLRNRSVLGVVVEDFRGGPETAVSRFPKTPKGPVSGSLFGDEPSAEEKPAFKPVLTTFPYALTEATLSFIDWVAAYNVLDRGQVLKWTIPFSVEELAKPDPKRALLPVLAEAHLQALFNRLTLTSEQEAAAAYLQAQKQFTVDLIDGVTGSGKTELYFSVLARRLLTSGFGESGARRCQALILLPEIALTVSLVSRFEQYFGVTPCLWHSNTARGQKAQIWRRAVQGEPLIVIGARSALFLPFKCLAAIVVDEEHDPSYKQNEQGIYNARDMAIIRGKLERIPVTLVSATPSLETVQNVQTGKYDCVKLPSRFARATLPDVTLVDMREEVGAPVLSRSLITAVGEALRRGEQTLLFINQRGYAPVSFCRRCGYHWKCPLCDVHLIEHRSRASGNGVKESYLLCHYCGYRTPLPESCPSCGAEKSRLSVGMGTERVLEVVHRLFPKARTRVLSSDTISSKVAWAEAIQTIHDGAVDVLLGTQILAKGHHFPLLTTVGVIDADQNAGGCNLRANERTYQLLDQVAGRAGRGAKKGRVFLQTYDPESPLLQALQRHDRDAFYTYELADRRRHGMPPFQALIAIIVSGVDELEVQKASQHLAQTFPGEEAAGGRTVLLGPAPAPLAKLRGHIRYRLLIKTDKALRLQSALPEWIAPVQGPVSVTIDVDPYEFL